MVEGMDRLSKGEDLRGREGLSYVNGLNIRYLVTVLTRHVHVCSTVAFGKIFVGEGHG